jgi:twitching motility protein PilT
MIVEELEVTSTGGEDQQQAGEGKLLTMSGLNGFSELFELMVQRGASDLHLRVPSPPTIRIDGELKPLDGFPPVTPTDVEMILDHIATPAQRESFLQELQLDIAYSIPGLARFRVSALRQRGTTSLAFRQVPFGVPSIDEFGDTPNL